MAVYPRSGLWQRCYLAAIAHQCSRNLVLVNSNSADFEKKPGVIKVEIGFRSFWEQQKKLNRWMAWKPTGFIYCEYP
jgi:hypothetical protein